MFATFTKRSFKARVALTPLRTSILRPYFQTLHQKFRVTADQCNPVFYCGSLLIGSSWFYVKYHKFSEIERVQVGSKLHDLVNNFFKDQVSIDHTHKRYTVDSFEHKRLHNTLQNLVASAKQYVENKIKVCEMKVNSLHDMDLSNFDLKQNEQDLLTWKFALSVIESELHLILISSEYINAAVPLNKSDTILITSELLNIFTEDEIAFALAHELSHILLGHIEEHKKLEIVCESVINLFCEKAKDGDLSCFGPEERYDNAVFNLFKSFRQCEHEADKLAVILARDAGYDMTKAAPSFFLKLHERQLLYGVHDKDRDTRNDSHPANLDRHVRMHEQANRLKNIPQTSNYLSAFSGWLGWSVSRMIRDYMRYMECK